MNQSNKIFVGNLSYEATEREVRDLFEEVARVESVKIISRGCAIVCMVNDRGCATAIEMLNGCELRGRALRLSAARPQAHRQ